MITKSTSPALLYTLFFAIKPIRLLSLDLIERCTEEKQILIALFCFLRISALEELCKRNKAHSYIS